MADRQEKEALKPKAKETEKKEEAKPESDDTKVNVPHASNRYQGQFNNLTKDLFAAAKNKVREQKMKEKQDHNAVQEKREKDAKLLKDIQTRNKELLAIQKARGTSGPTLKER